MHPLVTKSISRSRLRHGLFLIVLAQMLTAFGSAALAQSQQPNIVNAPHTAYDQPPAIYMDRVSNITDPNRQNYAAMVTAVDDGVGQVLQALQANNIVNNTLIFFLSDNGAPAT